MPKVGGRADGRRVSAAVKEILSREAPDRARPTTSRASSPAREDAVLREVEQPRRLRRLPARQRRHARRRRRRPSTAAEEVVREVADLIAGGHQISPGTISTVTGALDSQHVARRGARGRRLAPPLDEGRAEVGHAEALRRLDPPQHDHVRHRPGRHRQDVAGRRLGRRGAVAPRGQPDHPHPPRGRGRRAARLPARRPDGEGRPVPAPALRRAPGHARPRQGPAAPRARLDRGRAAGLHAWPDA